MIPAQAPAPFPHPRSRTEAGATARSRRGRGGKGPLTRFLGALAALVLLLTPAAAALALSAADFPPATPEGHVLDRSDVLSRAGRAEIERQLSGFGADRVDARLVTVDRLDYGLSLDALGQDLIRRWSGQGSSGTSLPLLLLLIDTQTRQAAVVAPPSLERQLPEELLRSTARTTMALPLREGERYRQATLDALARLSTVLEGGEDPGEPVEREPVAVVSNVPSREETAGSNAFTWVVVLLVVGSVVPMLTWWVFSR